MKPEIKKCTNVRLFVALHGHPHTVGIILTLPFLHIATESAEKNSESTISDEKLAVWKKGP